MVAAGPRKTIDNKLRLWGRTSGKSDFPDQANGLITVAFFEV
jgi:hypothetical protein